MTDSYVPFQPNGQRGRHGQRGAGKRRRDPATAPPSPTPADCRSARSSTSRSRASSTRPGTPFHGHAQPAAPARGTLAPGNVALTLPAGWTADAMSKPVGAVTDGTSNTVTFTITPPADAAVDTMYKIAARYTTGSATGYTDDTVRLVAPAEGRLQRFGKWLEYDNWLNNTAPAALPRSAARPRWPRS